MPSTLTTDIGIKPGIGGGKLGPGDGDLFGSGPSNSKDWPPGWSSEDAAEPERPHGLREQPRERDQGGQGRRRAEQPEHLGAARVAHRAVERPRAEVPVRVDPAERERRHARPGEEPRTSAPRTRDDG